MYRRRKFISVRKKDNGKLERIIIGRKENFQLEFYPSWGFTIKYLLGGYNDYGNPLFIFQFIFGAFYLTLPWKHNFEKDFGHDDPSYGITYHMKSFQFYWNRKCKVKNMFYSYDWIRTSLLLSDGTWEHETRGNSKTFYEEPWLSKQWKIVIPYKHRTSNEGDIDILVTCHITEREWRQKWLKWTKIGAKIRRTVDVEFSDEVGKGRGSWKGGTLATGFNINNDSCDIQVGLDKMEKEYNMYSIAWDRQRKIKQILEK